MNNVLSPKNSTIYENNLDIYQTNFASPFGLHYIIKVPL